MNCSLKQLYLRVSNKWTQMNILFWEKIEFSIWNWMIIMPQMLQLGRTSKFQRISNFQIERFPQNVWIVIGIFEILRVKLNSVTKIEWKWCPICWNQPKLASSTEFPEFQKILKKFQKIFEIWYSECKINFSD